MHKVRTTIQPGVELEVGDAELLDLQRQGLLLGEDKTPAAAPERESAPSAAAAPAKTPAPGKSSSKE